MSTALPVAERVFIHEQIFFSVLLPLHLLLNDYQYSRLVVNAVFISTFLHCINTRIMIQVAMGRNKCMSHKRTFSDLKASVMVSLHRDSIIH